MPTLRSSLRLLLLVAALLNYAAAAGAHDHDLRPLPGDGLCAICVYGGALGSAPVAGLPPLAPQWHALPLHHAPDEFRPPLLASYPIRGPPAFA